LPFLLLQPLRKFQPDLGPRQQVSSLD